MAGQKRRGRGLRRLARLLAVLLAGTAFLWWSNRSLQVARFDPVLEDLPAGFDGCRTAVLGDLHSAAFGEENRKLLEVLREEAPECIFLVGDLLDAFHEIPEGYAARTARDLADIAPTYYVTGNHEWAIGGVPDLKQTLTDQGVTVLSNEYTLLERGGGRLVLAGIDDPNGYADQKPPETLAAEIYADLGDPFWVLLAHRNDRFPTQYCDLGADLVISGHGHGGLIRLPFTDGLVSTDRTFFPSYTAGLYEKNGSALFVTRGLGNSGKTFRIFNRPEVAIVTLHAA